jgi:hypothetical protein
MSSNQNSSVENLELGGRGYKKKKPIVRRVREEHDTLILSFPKKIGLKLNQEVMIEQVGESPSSWEIRIKPVKA